MTRYEPPEDDWEGQLDEDTEAILSRRRFLISSTLAGAGLGATLSGCRRQPQEPKVCLTLDRPKPPYARPDQQAPPTEKPQPAQAKPQPCLEVPPPDKPPPAEPKP